MVKYTWQEEDRLVQHRTKVRDRNGEEVKYVVQIDLDAPPGQVNAKRIASFDPVIITDAYIPDATLEVDGVINPSSERLATQRSVIKASASEEERAGLINMIEKEKREKEKRKND